MNIKPPSTEELVFGRWLGDLGALRGAMQQFLPEAMQPYARLRLEQAYLKLCEAYELLLLANSNKGSQ